MKQANSISFPLYHALSSLRWPRRFSHKILLVAFLGTHVPLGSLVIYVLVGTSPEMINWSAIGVVLFGTLLGTVITLLSIQSLLLPVKAVGDALITFEKSHTLPNFDTSYKDEIGVLMNNTQNVLASLNQNIEQLEVSAQIDTLTKVLSRDAAVKRLEQIVTSYDSTERKVLLLFIDLNNFKSMLR